MVSSLPYVKWQWGTLCRVLAPGASSSLYKNGKSLVDKNPEGSKILLVVDWWQMAASSQVLTLQS
jgi:hypothetical protein